MRLALELVCAPHVRPKARYVVETFLHVLGLPPPKTAADPEAPVIAYGHPTDDLRQRLARSGGVLIHASPAGERFFLDRRPLRPQDVIPLRWGADRLPLLFPPNLAGDRAEADGELRFRRHDGKVIEVFHDIILPAFYVLSRWEETVSDAQDEHGRFPHRASLASRLDPSRMMVDQYFSVFRTALNAALTSLSLSQVDVPLWEGGCSFAACLTHDVDVVSQSWPSRARSLLNVSRLPGPDTGRSALARRIGLAWQVLSRGRHLRWTFPSIIGCEEEAGFRSSFYFPASRAADPHCDFAISEPRVQRLFADLLERGFEVGLHGSYHSALNLERFCDEKRALERALGQQVIGHRQHYLRFKYQPGFTVYERSGLGHDSSLGFAEQEGYRNQFSYPYYPYNHEEDRPFTFLELPLVIMDTTLYGYRHLTAQAAWESVERLLRQAQASRGCITLLWHNPSFSEVERPSYRQVYLEVLRWIAEHNALGASGARVSELWQARTQRLSNAAVPV